MNGAMALIPYTLDNMTLTLDSLVDKHFTELFSQCTFALKAAADMGFL